MGFVAVEKNMEDTACPLCGRSERTRLYRNGPEGNGLSGVAVSVVQCNDCGFLYSAPRLSVAALEAYYAASSLASGQVFRDESAAGVYPRLYAQRAKFLAAFMGRRTSGRLLDIGCGNGGFLRALADCQLPGWQLQGLEPSQGAVVRCRELGFDVVAQSLETADFPPHSFDVISMVSVLEHLPDPLAALHGCRRILKPDGLLLIEVPDNLQPELSLTSHFNVEHIVHFTPYTLQEMLLQAGFPERSRELAAAGVIRQVSAQSLSSWGGMADPVAADDRHEVLRIVKAYAVAEAQLLSAVRIRVTTSLNAWHRAGLTVAIYGAGIHSLQLASLVDLNGLVSCFVDGDPAKQGGTFLGLPVYPPEALRELGVAAVLISSNRFVDEMLHKVRAICGDNVEIASCYQ